MAPHPGVFDRGACASPTPLAAFRDFSYPFNVIEHEISLVLEAVPEFTDRYLSLVEAADEDPGAAAMFVELADYVAELVAELERSRPTLERCLAGVEKVADTSVDAEELLIWAFFDNLSPDDVRHLDPWLGPRTRILLDETDQSPG
jgi:hypothetical protein